jgi:hypothetical protein
VYIGQADEVGFSRPGKTLVGVPGRGRESVFVLRGGYEGKNRFVNGLFTKLPNTDEHGWDFKPRKTRKTQKGDEPGRWKRGDVIR